MKKYTSLIRKLVDATAEADFSGTDVADILKQRCFSETNIVRQTLMNAVCDPRFKIGADVTGKWKGEARTALEQLADTLENTVPLTEEKAYYILNDFLSEWFNLFLDELQISTKKQKRGTPEELLLLDLRSQLSILGDGVEELVGEKPLDDVDIYRIKNGRHNKEPLDGPSEGEEVVADESKDGQRNGYGRSIQVLEDRFLQKIPPSLIALARRIGRVGENGHHSYGRFQTAGKSDIVGITVGNDLSAILPSELALLAGKHTQKIFYHNFAAKRLQLFASASQSNKDVHKHQDGPVIICVDVSSSMTGIPMLLAKVMAITVTIIAWRRRRDVLVVKYSDNYDCIELGNHHSRLGDLLKFLHQVESGNNNENEMFAWLFQEVKPDLSAYENADILCISDFGWIQLNQATEDIIKEQKTMGVRFYGLNIESQTSSILNYAAGKAKSTPMDVCDSVWTFEGGKCKEITFRK